jgi:hypothetical protein
LFTLKPAEWGIAVLTRDREASEFRELRQIQTLPWVMESIPQLEVLNFAEFCVWNNWTRPWKIQRALQIVREFTVRHVYAVFDEQSVEIAGLDAGESI